MQVAEEREPYVDGVGPRRSRRCPTSCVWVERSRENPMFVEDYLAREHPGGESEDPTAPPVAGGAV
jgi:hypothetical protein